MSGLITVAYTPEYAPHIRRVATEGDYSGSDYEMVNYIARAMNKTLRMIPSVDGDWGSYVDGNWTGVIGMLERGVS